LNTEAFAHFKVKLLYLEIFFKTTKRKLMKNWLRILNLNVVENEMKGTKIKKKNVGKKSSSAK
jgi:hypothetical protein